MSYFAFMFGKENIVAAHLHRDEETPHTHITLVPIVKGNVSAGNGGTDKETLPQEADRHRKTVCR